jgi:hypothetical protein
MRGDVILHCGARAAPRVAGERSHSSHVARNPRHRVARREGQGLQASALALYSCITPAKIPVDGYFLKGVAPQWQLSDIYKGMIQFMVLQLAGLALLMMLPQLALWLPGVLYTR